jgi:hypothetical protein
MEQGLSSPADSEGVEQQALSPQVIHHPTDHIEPNKPAPKVDLAGIPVRSPSLFIESF